MRWETKQRLKTYGLYLAIVIGFTLVGTAHYLLYLSMKP